MSNYAAILTEEEEIEHMNRCVRNNVFADEAERARRESDARNVAYTKRIRMEAEMKEHQAQLDMEKNARKARRGAAMRVTVQIICWVVGIVSLLVLAQVDAVTEWFATTVLTVWTGWIWYTIGVISREVRV